MTTQPNLTILLECRRRLARPSLGWLGNRRLIRRLDGLIAAASAEPGGDLPPHHVEPIAGQILALIIRHGLSVDEVARDLRMSPRRVRRHLRRAISRIGRDIDGKKG